MTTTDAVEEYQADYAEASELLDIADKATLVALIANYCAGAVLAGRADAWQEGLAQLIHQSYEADMNRPSVTEIRADLEEMLHI